MSTGQEELELIEAEPFGGELIDFDQAPPFMTNYHCGDPMERWAFCARVTGADCKKGKEMVNMPFRLKWWFVHEALVKDRETGEPRKQLRSVLIDDQGNSFGFVAQSMIASLRMLIGNLGHGPYDPPIAIVVKSGTSNDGGNFYTIEPAPRRAAREK